MLRAECDSSGDKREAAEVMKRSRVWFWVWVGKLTCWTRLTEDRRFRNSVARGLEGLSTWMLKSPVRTNSFGVVAASERSEPSSSRMTEDVEEYLDEVGGR